MSTTAFSALKVSTTSVTSTMHCWGLELTPPNCCWGRGFWVEGWLVGSAGWGEAAKCSCWSCGSWARPKCVATQIQGWWCVRSAGCCCWLAEAGRCSCVISVLGCLLMAFCRRCSCCMLGTQKGIKGASRAPKRDSKLFLLR